MSDTEIFSFPYGAFLKVRLEFVLLRDDDLQARIMRIIEGWMIDKKKKWENEVAEAASQGKPEPPEPEYWCTLSYAQIIAQLYKFNSSRGSGKKDKPNGKEVVDGKTNTITRVTVGNAMHALIADSILFTRANPNPTKEYDASQYTLNIPLIQEQMSHLPKNAMSYLGSNGRINGIPCKDFLRPPEELALELGHKPRKSRLRGGENSNTPHVNEIYVPHVNETYNLIDSNTIDLSLDYPKEKEEDRTSANQPRESISHTTTVDVIPSLQDLSDEEFLKEMKRRNLLAQAPSQETHTPSVENAHPPTIVGGQPALFEVAPSHGGDHAKKAPIQKMSTHPIAERLNVKLDKKTGLTPNGAHMKELWEAQSNRTLTNSRENVHAFNDLANVVQSDEDFIEVRQEMKTDAYYVANDVRVTPDLMSRKYDGFMDKLEKKRAIITRKREMEERQHQQQVSGVLPIPVIRQLTELELKNREMKARFARPSVMSAR